MALLVVVVLGMPKFAVAGQPAVSDPAGAGKTLYNGTYYFTGPYTFDTYISCSGGAQFNSSYSNFLAGTNTFRFYGAPDGSLLVTINGGGSMLVTSCGNPFATPATLVATYSVAVGTPPPPPPTPTPTPTPMPTPAVSGPHGSTHSGGGTTATGGSTPLPSPSGTSSPTPIAATAQSPLPAATPGGPRLSAVGNIGPAGSSRQTPLPDPRLISLAWRAGAILLLAVAWLLLAAWRSRRWRERWRGLFTTPRLRLEARWFNFRIRVRQRLRAAIRVFTPKVHGREQPKRPGLSAHHHSGRVLAHHHTSYPALIFLLILAAVLTAAVSLAGRAANSNLSLTVLGPPPTSAATIDSPASGQHFGTNTVTVQGTCPAGLLIEIYRNATFAGSALCDSGGLYSVLVTLVPGQNDLVARDSDALGQYGPDSATVTVYYDAPPPPTSTPTPPPTPVPSGSPQPGGPPASKTPGPPGPAPTRFPANPSAPATLLLTSKQHLYQGTGPGTPVQWTVTVSGGRAPYRFLWEWGDGTSSNSTMAAAGPATGSHSYAKPGVYQVTIRADDDNFHEAVIQVVTIINGATTLQTFGRSTPDQPGNLVLVWPLLSVTGLVVLSFWLGEHHGLSLSGPKFMPATDSST
jgi:hypothetical protein